ncbi:MAG: hypothetical protein RBU45_23035 [Myxococcota bacterium]|jgi:hypothetical protein|nr:hypothetical protein [Myxococcota bacterium]
MSDSTPIFRVLEALPQGGLTVNLLKGLDYLVPGEWQNITSFEGMIRAVSGEDDQSLIQAIGERALQLYADPQEGYQRAVWVYQKLDSVDKVAGAAAAAQKLGERFSALSFMNKITPKADTTQAIDAGLKFAGELVAFCLCNGIPGDRVADFAKSLVQYGKEDKMRLAAWLAFDCILPLGPDFLGKITGGLQQLTTSALSGNGMFQQIASYLPGSIQEQKKLLETNLAQSSGFLTNFVRSHNITPQGVLDKVKGIIEVTDDRLDYVAATIDLASNFYEHTGVQSVARRLISRAYGEI